MRYKKEHRETQTHLECSSDFMWLKPASRWGEELSSSPSWIVDSADVEEHSPETTFFSFSSDVTKNNKSVSIILEWPTLHLIQTTHLFPVWIYLQAFRGFFPFSFYFIYPPTLSPHWANRPMGPIRKPNQQHAPAPVDFPGAKTSQVFLVCVC